MTNWKDIHPDFARDIGAAWKSKIYQESWEKRNIDYQEAEEWIRAEFEPADYVKVEKWKKHYFTPQEAKFWINIGLTKKDAEFVAYLRWKSYQPNQNLNLEQLKVEFVTWLKNKTAQEYLDWKYPQLKRKAITELDISEKDLLGSLDLSDFVNLKVLICFDSNLTSLDLNNCVNLVEISCESNQQLTRLILPGNPVNLKALSLSNNSLNQDLSFLNKAINLEYLDLGNNKFTGSLGHLKDLGKLELLNIRDNDIDGGLEYLPESVKEFKCSINKKQDAKVKFIKDNFEQHFNSKLEDYQKWRKDIKHILVRAEDIQKDISRCFSGYSNQEVQAFKDPREIEKHRNRFWWAKQGGRVIMTASGILSLNNYPMLGGGIAITYPWIEAVISEKEKEWVENDENKWDRFVTDSKQLWNDYQELVEILRPCEFFGEFSQNLGDLKKLEKKIKTLEENDELTKEEQKKLADLKNQVKSPLRRKNNTLYSSWKKLEEIHPHNLEELEESAEITKNKFAQDLWKNWKDRKEQWKEIGEKLVEASKHGTENTDKKINDVLEVVIDIKENIQQVAQTVQQSNYGTFGISSSNKTK